MRAATWSINRDIGAARASWERARQSPIRYPPMNRTDRHAHRPAHHAVRNRLACPCQRRRRFDELRDLCAAAGDKASLAIGMAGLAVDHCGARVRDASQLASEQMALMSRSAIRP